MSTERAQNFENHRTRDFVLIAAMLIYLVSTIIGIAAYATNHPEWNGIAIALIGFGLLALSIKVRRYALIVQDRVIRLEMRLRLERMLPADLQPKIADLTLGQLVALRFASDAELPELTRKVLAENLQNRTAIKRQIKNWH